MLKGSLHKIQVRFSFVISNQNVKKLSKNRTGEKALKLINEATHLTVSWIKEVKSLTSFIHERYLKNLKETVKNFRINGELNWK